MTRETLAESWGLQCPHCGDCDRIDICASVWVRLTEDGTDADEAHTTDHEWNDQDAARCDACGHVGTVGDFKTEQKEGAA